MQDVTVTRRISEDDLSDILDSTLSKMGMIGEIYAAVTKLKRRKSE